MSKSSKGSGHKGNKSNVEKLRKPPVLAPGKEIQLDPAEKTNTQELNMKMGVVHNQIGFNRRLYLKNERQMMADFDVMQSKMDTTIDMIKKKYKIIGQIKNIDFNRGVIIFQLLSLSFCLLANSFTSYIRTNPTN